MSKLSAPVKDAIQPYQDALSQIRELETTKGNLEHKRLLLEKEIVTIDDRLNTIATERPLLLEQVLSGSRSEGDLTAQQLQGEKLRAERKSKEDLLTLVAKQVEAKVQARVDRNGRLAPVRRSVFAAIEAELLAQMPSGCLEYLTKLHTVAHGNGRTVLGLLEDLLPKHDHNGWERERNRILEEYGIHE